MAMENEMLALIGDAIATLRDVVRENARLRDEMAALRTRIEALEAEQTFCAFAWLDPRGSAYRVELAQLGRFEVMRGLGESVHLLVGPTTRDAARAAALAVQHDIHDSAGHA